MNRRSIFKTYILLLGDSALLYSALFFTLLIRYWHDPDFVILIRLHVIPFTYVFILWVFIFGSSGLYDLRLTKNNRGFLLRLVRVMIVNIIAAISIFYLLPFKVEPRRNLLVIAALAVIFISLWRYLFNALAVKTSGYRVLFLGVNDEVAELTHYLLHNPQLGQKPVGLAIDKEIDGRIATQIPIPCHRLHDNLHELVGTARIDTIVIAPEVKENKELINALFRIVPLGVWISEFPHFYEMLTGKIPLYLIHELWFIENLVGIKKKTYECIKRIIDIIFSLMLGGVAILLFPLAALGIKIESHGPIFFRQKRVGKNGKVFDLLKYRSTYRTRVDETEGWDKDDLGIYTKTGKFLRRSYLDELPQIINVLRGDMSFIGPRPERPEFVEELEKKTPFYKMRLLAKPGLAGWAQVHMENDASAKDASEKMQYDLYYIKNRSLALDLLITLKTAGILMRRQGR